MSTQWVKKGLETANARTVRARAAHAAEYEAKEEARRQRQAKKDMDTLEAAAKKREAANQSHAEQLRLAREQKLAEKFTEGYSKGDPVKPPKDGEWRIMSSLHEKGKKTHEAALRPMPHGGCVPPAGAPRSRWRNFTRLAGDGVRETTDGGRRASHARQAFLFISVPRQCRRRRLRQ